MQLSKIEDSVEPNILYPAGTQMMLPLLELIFELRPQKTQKVAIEVFDMVMLQRKYDYSREAGTRREENFSYLYFVGAGDTT